MEFSSKFKFVVYLLFISRLFCNAQTKPDELSGLIRFNVRSLSLENDSLFILNSENPTDIFLKIYKKRDPNYGYVFCFFTDGQGELPISEIGQYFGEISPVMMSFEKRQEVLYFECLMKTKKIFKFRFGENISKYVVNNFIKVKHFSFEQAFSELEIEPIENQKIWVDTTMTKELIFERIGNYYSVNTINGDWIYVEIIPMNDFYEDTEGKSYPKGWLKWREGEELKVRFFEGIY